MENKVTPASCLFAVIWLPCLIVVSSIYRGWILTILWDWFVIPTFNQAPVLSVPAAIGLLLIVGYLAKDFESSNNKNKEPETLWEVIIGTTLKLMMLPTLSLLFGYIVSFYI